MTLRPVLPMVVACAALAAALFARAATSAAATAGEPREFTARTLAALRQAHAGQRFAVVLWSVNCEPCKEELALVTRLHREYPRVPVHLVAADPPALRAQVLRMLRRYQMGAITSWQFGDEAVERVRYAIDPRWRGELPRAYFFNAAHEPTAHTGVLDPVWLKAWLSGSSH